MPPKIRTRSKSCTDSFGLAVIPHKVQAGKVVYLCGTMGKAARWRTKSRDSLDSIQGNKK